MFQNRWEERENDFTEEEKKEAWDEIAGIVKTYSDELVDRWNKEIDTLLVYVCVDRYIAASCHDMDVN